MECLHRNRLLFETESSTWNISVFLFIPFIQLFQHLFFLLVIIFNLFFSKFRKTINTVLLLIKKRYILQYINRSIGIFNSFFTYNNRICNFILVNRSGSLNKLIFNCYRLYNKIFILYNYVFNWTTNNLFFH